VLEHGYRIAREVPLNKSHDDRLVNVLECGAIGATEGFCP